MAERFCATCAVPLKSKNYRCLAKLDKNVLGLISEQLRTIDGHVCFQCANRINRVSNLETDIEKNKNKLTQQKETILQGLKDNFVQSNTIPIDISDISIDDLGVTPIPLTPKKSGTKRPLIKTPTPKKFIKRPLHSTPKHIPIKEKQKYTDESTQTTVRQVYTKKFQVKVSVNDKGKIKSKIVQDKHQVSFLKQLVHGHDDKKLSKAIYNSSLHNELRNLFIKELQRDCTNISKTTSSTSLREKDAQELASIDWISVADEWKQASDILCPVIEAISGKSLKDNPARLVFPCSSLLYTRNRSLNKLQEAAGLVLDSGGATDETINLFHGLGSSVSPKTIWRRKQHLLSAHETVFKEYQVFRQQTERKEMLDCVLPSLQSTTTVNSSDYEHRNREQSITVDILPHIETVLILPAEGQSSALPSPCHAEGRTPMTTVSYSHAAPRLHGDRVLDGRAHCASSHTSPPGINTDSSNPSSAFGIPKNLERETSVATQKRTKEILCQLVKDTTSESTPIEIYGDNLDLMKNPSTMTMKRQRESLHWFLVLAAKRRVICPQLPNSTPKADIKEVDTIAWMPTPEDLSSYNDNLDYHIVKVLVKYLPFLRKYGSAVPEFISHPHVQETSEKSSVTNCYLIDESENSSDGMIKILKRIDADFVPSYNGATCERVVFGGDVLTNERAFSAQQAMQTKRSTTKKVQGFVHRPEGLHRVMNLIQNIYQLFYMEGSSREKGTLSQLRNEVNRRDVSGADAVTKAFRSHHKFIDDALDAYIIAAALTYFGMESADDEPSQNEPSPLLLHQSADSHYAWLKNTAKCLKETLMPDSNDPLTELSKAVSNYHQGHIYLETYRDGDLVYHCPVCHKTFKRTCYFKGHMEKVHNRYLTPSTSNPSPSSSLPTNSNAVTATFINMALLARDTYNAYRMCDGDRVFRNAKLEFLYAFKTGHVKYRLWLWRMLAYEAAILSERAAYEYKWNVAVNLKGGIGENIPNDNCVELQVKRIKEKVMAQGANKSFASASVATRTTQIVDQIGQQMRAGSAKAKGKKRCQVDKTEDIMKMTSVIKAENVNAGIHFPSFTNFKDPLKRIKSLELHKWIQEQRKVAAQYMLLK